MRRLLKILKKRVIILFAITCLYSCTRPEERIEKNEVAVSTKAHTVVIQQMKFIPAELTVNEGDTVIWINRDIVEHNVTEEANKEWTSSSLPQGKSWSMVVKKAATYFCTIHPVMQGKLIVKQ